jgi:hypothetical protein
VIQSHIREEKKENIKDGDEDDNKDMIMINSEEFDEI